jgi:hypothetical protein
MSGDIPLFPLWFHSVDRETSWHLRFSAILGGIGWQLVTEVQEPIRSLETTVTRYQNTPRKIPQWHGLSHTAAETWSTTVHVYCFQTVTNSNFVCQTASGILLYPFHSSKYLTGLNFAVLLWMLFWILKVTRKCFLWNSVLEVTNYSVKPEGNTGRNCSR